MDHLSRGKTRKTCLETQELVSRGGRGVPRIRTAGAGLGDEERAGEVDVEEVAELGGVVGFGFYVGAFLCVWLVSVGGFGERDMYR